MRRDTFLLFLLPSTCASKYLNPCLTNPAFRPVVKLDLQDCLWFDYFKYNYQILLKFAITFNLVLPFSV